MLKIYMLYNCFSNIKNLFNIWGYKFQINIILKLHRRVTCHLYPKVIFRKIEILCEKYVFVLKALKFRTISI